MTNAVLNAIQKRSSTRFYTDEALSDEQIETLVQAGLQAPTARNAQTLHFSIVDGKNAALKGLDADFKASRGVTNSDMTFYFNAPMVALISASENVGFEEIDAGIAVQTMALAAHSMGLGSVIIGCIRKIMNGEQKASYDASFGIPEGYNFQIAIAIGHISQTKEPHEYDKEKLVNFVK